MSRGRPPNWNAFSGLVPGAWTEVVEVSTKWRLTLPTAVRGRLGWLEGIGDEGLLAVLDPQGRAEVAPWAARGAKAVADVSQRLDAAPPEHRDEIAIAAMDRYMRMAVEPPARVTLHPNLAAHLNAGEGDIVRVIVMANRLWLWSELQWQARRMDRIVLLAEPGT